MSTETAILAGGCFWGMEDLIHQLSGVTDTEVGYTGGHFKNPTYPDMRTGQTGHAEAIKIDFDPDVISYTKLLEFFFQIHDPTTTDRQGNDRGSQYRSAIFYLNENQQAAAHRVLQELDSSGKWPGKIVTQIVPATEFYQAEDGHQDYLENNPGGYTCHWIRPNWTVDDL